MFLKSAHLRHYKSLDNVLIDFSTPITVLVGPNAVGKSNVVDCLRFVRDAVAIDLEHAISSRGGIGRIRQYSKTKPFKVSIKLEFDQDGGTSPGHAARYEFSIQSETGSNYVVDGESGSWYESSRDGRAPERREFERDKTGSTNVKGEARPWRIPKDHLALGQAAVLRFPGWPMQRFIRDWRYSAVYPNRLREPRSPDRDKVLAEDGSNWASVVKALRRSARGKAALERVYEAIRIVAPTFEEVTVSTVGSYLVPRFKFSLGAHDKVEFDPVQLSDGTLRIFGILLALYQIPAPQLLVIEEPEQNVHPGALGVLADAFREAAESTQVIVTTHSPHFIDHFAPEEVRVISLDKGVSKVSRIKQTQLEAVRKRLMSMQDFMLAEGLQAEEA